MLHGPSRAQNTLSRAPQDVVLSVVPKTAQRYARSDRLGFCRDQGIDAAPLEGTIDLRVRISGIGGNRLNVDPSGRFDLVNLGRDHLPLILFSRRHLDVEGHAHLGAQDYSGRLFRINASRPSGSQSTHLTHSNTALGSAPHADSRDMAIAANGVLIEVDDGGIYRRTHPEANDVDWFSMNGDLTTTEFHSVAWDANCHTVIGGAQDTGSPEQLANSGARWRSVSTGDGGVVAVDAISTAGFSTRYSSFQNLGGFRRQVFDAAGALQSSSQVGLFVLGGGPKVQPHFYTPVVLNRVTPTRLIIGGANAVYESDDQGDTLTAIGPGCNDTGPIAYGAAGNADMLYVGSGRNVLIRTAAHPAPLVVSASYPGATTVVGIAMMPGDPLTAFAIDSLQIFYTTNVGGQWSNITHNLAALGVTVLRSVTYCSGLGSGAVVVGSNSGIFAAERPAFATWTRLGTGLPMAPVLHLEYSAADRVLLAATMGRGAWTLTLPEPVIV